MELYIFEVDGVGAGDCVGMIDSYTSFNFTKSFQECGNFTLKGNYTKQANDYLKVGRLLYVNPRVCGIIHTVDWQMDENGAMTYAAYGTELKGILSYRIAWNIYDHSLPTNDWIYKLVQENVEGERQLFSHMHNTEAKCPTYDKQVSYKQLDECVQDACEAQHTSADLLLGYDVICDIDKGFDFCLLEGSNRSFGTDDPVLISRYVDNVTTLEYANSSQNEVNTVLVGGEGEGTDRVLYTATLDDKTYKYLDRREFFDDARNIQKTYKDGSGTEHTLSDADYKKKLLQDAYDDLSPRAICLDAETVITPEQGLELLGCKVTVLDRELGVKTDDYITEINIIDEADGNLTTLTVGKNVNAQLIIL